MFAIVRDPIDPRALERATVSDRCGAIVTFAGVVRERSDDGRPVTGLSYEAYDTMAVGEFETIASEARDRFGDVDLTIVHRIGDLGIGEIAVVVVAAAAHRAAAFDACEYAIDAVKARASIWKKERYLHGAEWKANDLA